MNTYTEPAAPATKTATDSSAPSWRDILPIHPAAALFPRLSRDELRALGEDILENGQRVPIALWKERTELPPSLLDGIGRLDAMEAVGLHVEVNFFGSPQGPTHVSLYYWHPGGERTRIATTDIVGDDPRAYVISANIRRRHLSIEDKDRLIVQLLKADPTKSNRIVAKLTDTSHPHVAKVRERAEKVGDVETVTTSIDTKGRAQPARKPPRVTPAAIKQIKKLVERGASREDIATTIGVTIDWVQSTCSLLGIRLRRKATTTPTRPPLKDTRDEIGLPSGEITRKDTPIEELQAEKRQLEIENVGLRSEIQEAKAERKPKLASNGEPALRCSFCDKDQHQVDHLVTSGSRLQPVCICNECVDLCVEIIGKQQKAAAASETNKSVAEAAPPADDGLALPRFCCGPRHDRRTLSA
jgi:hypothetical protein